MGSGAAGLSAAGLPSAGGGCEARVGGAWRTTSAAVTTTATPRPVNRNVRRMGDFLRPVRVRTGARRRGMGRLMMRRLLQERKARSGLRAAPANRRGRAFRLVRVCRPGDNGVRTEGPAMPPAELDLNCDLGEGCPYDAELLPLVTSANVACGGHAGDPSTAFATLALAARHGIRAGAHPGFADREHFGRRELARTEAQVYEECVYQVGA